tara:strand:- start:1746 stop:2168 length:423 start_codon:yes stop_codon:yes gene_type:complete
MKKDQLFKKNPSNELFDKILNSFGLTGLDDKRSFSRKDLKYIKTVEKINALKADLDDCYLPCKSRTYLSLLNEKNVITILRQILKTRNYTIASREKYMKGCKFIIYNLCKTEQKTYKPLIEIKSDDESGDDKKPIVLTFN